jgi:hypothetical protein
VHSPARKDLPPRESALRHREPTSWAPSKRVRTPITTRIADAIDITVEAVSASLLVGTVAIAFVQVVFRYLLNSALSWPEEMARFAFVWFVFLAAAMVTRRSRHIVIDLLPRALGPRALRVHACASRIVSAAVAGSCSSTAPIVLKSYVSPALGGRTPILSRRPTGAAISLVLALERRAIRSGRSGALSTLGGLPCISRWRLRPEPASWARSASSGRW